MNGNGATYWDDGTLESGIYIDGEFYSGFYIDYPGEIIWQVSTEPTASPTSGKTYVGNKKSKKFHYSWCEGVATMKEENKIILESRDEAIVLGYAPCGTCKP